MADEMSPWRSLASSASRSIKGYVAQRDLKRAFPASRAVRPGQPSESNLSLRQTWGQWAGQKLRNLGQNDESTNSAIEKLALFPGWATRRYRESTLNNSQDTPSFDVEVLVSGFSSKFNGPGFGTRSGRAFLRLAKGYAALPKLMGASGPAVEALGAERPLSRSEEEVLTSAHLPARPDEITEESEIRELEEQLHQLEFDTASVATSETSVSSSSQHSNSFSAYPLGTNTPISGTVSNNLQRLHANLESRLHPFWSSALSARTVRISVYFSDPTIYATQDSPLLVNYSDDEYTVQHRPIATRDVLTAADGSFQVKLSLQWEHMCVHPGALHIAFGDQSQEHELFVLAQLLPPPSRPPTPVSAQPSTQYYPRPPRNVIPTVTTLLSVTLTHTPIRVISDIDDTVKLSGIISGARAAFHNVFVKDLGDSIIPGMGEWYTSMYRRGVRFHYVSNGPFELLPVVNEFLQLSRLPPGSVKLKSYAGRSLFNGLLSAPAERKRAGIVDILDSFPNSKFVLIGDSGEQDLELYASFARERPDRILAIFIRDANYGGPEERVKPLEDPTGEAASKRVSGNGFSPEQTSMPITIPQPAALPSSRGSINAKHAMRRPPSRSVSESASPPRPTRYMARKPTRTHSYADIPSSYPGFPQSQNGMLNAYPSSMQSSSSNILTDSPVSEEPLSLPSSTPYMYPPPPNKYSPPGYFSTSRSSTMSSMGRSTPMSDAEKKQRDLQTRVYRARMDIPNHIPLRIFRNPEECVEAANILNSHLGKRT